MAAIGYPLGRVKIGGTSLGVAAVLFVGLAFGALDPDLKLPEVIYQVGTGAVCLYHRAGQRVDFLRLLGKKGLRYNGLVVGGLLLATLLAVLAHHLFKLSAAIHRRYVCRQPDQYPGSGRRD